MKRQWKIRETVEDEEAVEKVIAVFRRYPEMNGEKLNAIAERLNRGEWTVEDAVAICLWKDTA